MTLAGPFDLGDSVELTCDATDAAGNPANLDTLVCTVTLPDGLTTDTLDPANPPAETGAYSVDFASTMAGRHRINWLGTGPSFGYADVLDIMPADPRFIISLADAREQLRRLPGTSTVDDQELRLYTAAVTSIVEDIVGSQSVQSRTFTADGGKVSVLLPDAPLAILSVTENGVELTVESGDYTIDYAAGIIYRGSQVAPFAFIPGLRNVAISYTIGTGLVAANIRLAARIILRHLFSADQQGGPGLAIRDPDDDDLTASPQGFAVPYRAAELLKPSTAQQMPGFA